MGNVLTKYKLSDYIGTYTEDEAQAVLLKNQVCASVEWICMDRGTMTDEEAGAESADGGAFGRVEGTGVPFVFDVKYITPFPGIFKKYSVCRVYGRHLDFV